MIAAIVIDEERVPLWKWLFGRPEIPGPVPGVPLVPGAPSALVTFVITIVVLLLAALVVGYLVAAFRRGPIEAFPAVGRAIAGAVTDLVLISPRRILGLTILAIREAMRRHIWVVLVIYVVVLMFAAWVLNPGSDSRLASGDQVIVVGERASLARLAELADDG